MARSFAKDVNTARIPASITKVVTAVVAREWVNNEHLDDVVTVTSADSPAGPGAGGVSNGDMVTYRDLFYLMLMTSRDDATHCLARCVGGLMVAAGGSGSSDPHTRFVEQMNARALALGASTALFYDSGGSSANNRLSPADISLMTAILAQDSFLLTAAGTKSRSVTTKNGSPRTFACINLFDPTGASQPDARLVTGYAFPEHVASKYGITTEAGFCMTMIWETRTTGRRITVVMGAANDEQLKRDMRALINYEAALTKDFTYPGTL
jgi:D-alanyl-D-alanine carboxypeptidase